MNLGIFILVYGLVVSFLIKYEEMVKISCGDVKIYFLMVEEKGVLFWKEIMGFEEFFIIIVIIVSINYLWVIRINFVI